MNVIPLQSTGNSSKFNVSTKKGEFTLALSFTLKTKIWQLPDVESELEAAKQLAEAIISRHDPALPFRKLYIFAEHNTLPTLDEAVRYIRKKGY